jgi:hypothetical protein
MGGIAPKSSGTGLLLQTLVKKTVENHVKVKKVEQKAQEKIKESYVDYTDFAVSSMLKIATNLTKT